METFKRLLAYAKPYSRYWPGYLFLSILSVIFGVANYALIGPVLSVLFEPQNVSGELLKPEFAWTIDYVKDLFNYYLSDTILVHGTMRGLVFVCAMLVFATFLADLTRYLSQRILVSMKTKMMYNIRKDLFRKISDMNIGFFNNQRKGDILSSISNGFCVGCLPCFFSEGLVKLVVQTSFICLFEFNSFIKL